MRAPDPTPRTYQDSNHRAKLILARANERMVDSIAKGETRSKRAAKIEADSNFKRAYSEFFDKADPSMPQQVSASEEVKNAYEGEMTPHIAQRGVNFVPSKKAFYDNKTPSNSRG